jgi:hypothetical protein
LPEDMGQVHAVHLTRFDRRVGPASARRGAATWGWATLRAGDAPAAAPWGRS